MYLRDHRLLCHNSVMLIYIFENFGRLCSVRKNHFYGFCSQNRILLLFFRFLRIAIYFKVIFYLNNGKWLQKVEWRLGIRGVGTSYASAHGRVSLFVYFVSLGLKTKMLQWFKNGLGCVLWFVVPECVHSGFGVIAAV